MLFSSFVFLSAFLPLTLLCYYVVPRIARNVVGTFKNILAHAAASPRRQLAFDAWLLALLVLSMSFLAGASYNPFINFSAASRSKLGFQK